LIKHSAYILLLSLLFMACTPAGKVKPVSMDILEFTFEGPITPGAHTAQIEVNTQEQILKSTGLTLDQIQKFQIQSAYFTTSDSNNFSNMNRLTLQAVSDKNEMKNLCMLDPMNTTNNKVELKVAQDLDLKPYLSESVFYLLLDVEFEAMQMEGKTVSGTITFQATVSE
jgi:mannitol-specific phosphotransferase system IIBC component